MMAIARCRWTKSRRIYVARLRSEGKSEKDHQHEVKRRSTDHASTSSRISASTSSTAESTPNACGIRRSATASSSTRPTLTPAVEPRDEGVGPVLLVYVEIRIEVVGERVPGDVPAHALFQAVDLGLGCT
jgi:hypothetical protein